MHNRLKQYVWRVALDERIWILLTGLLLGAIAALFLSNARKTPLEAPDTIVTLECAYKNRKTTVDIPLRLSPRVLTTPPETLPYWFTGPAPIHPAIIEDLQGWTADSGTQIASINLLDAQEAHRYFGEFLETNGAIRVKYPAAEAGGFSGRHFEYRLLGSTPHGIHILHTIFAGSKQTADHNLLFVTLETSSGFECATGDALPAAVPRLHINAVGTIALGEHYPGDITFQYPLLTIPDRDAAQPATKKKPPPLTIRFK